MNDPAFSIGQWASHQICLTTWFSQKELDIDKSGKIHKIDAI
jgi:hypothetical protein